MGVVSELERFNQNSAGGEVVMRAKLALTKNFGENNHGGNQSNGTRNMKNVNFVPKDVQKGQSSHKI